MMATLLLVLLAGAGVDDRPERTGVAGTATGTVSFPDDIQLTWGDASDAALVWDTSGTHRLELNLLDCGGATPCTALYVNTGTDDFVFSGSLLIPDGTAAAPALAFTSDADGSGTGIYRAAPNTIGFVSNGSPKLVLGTATFDVRTRLYDSTAALNLGTATTTSHSLGTGDVLVGGKLEVDGVSFFDAAVSVAGNVTTTAGSFLTAGAFSAATSVGGVPRFFPRNAAQTPDTGSLGLGTEANSLLIIEQADDGFDFAHPLQPNPTMFIHSANQSTTEWLSLAHDQTDGVIDSGTDSINLAVTTIKTDPYNHCRTIKAHSSGLGPTAPSPASNGTFYGLEFDQSTPGETVGIEWEVPNDWDAASDITLKIYWTPESGTAIPLNGTVKWDITYRSVLWGTDDTDTGTAVSDSVTYTEAANPGDDNDTHESEIVLDYDNANQPIAVGESLGVEFSRDEVTDTYNGDALVVQFEFCYTANKLKRDHN